MELIKPDTTIDFVGPRRLFGMASLGLVLVSLALIVYPGPNYGIDFKGGTSIIVAFDEDVELGDITNAMTDLGFTDAVVQQFGTDEERQYVIQTSRISVISREQADSVRDALAARFPDLQFEFDEDSGDRIEIRVPEGLDVPSTATGTPDPEPTPEPMPEPEPTPEPEPEPVPEPTLEIEPTPVPVPELTPTPEPVMEIEPVTPPTPPEGAPGDEALPLPEPAVENAGTDEAPMSPPVLPDPVSPAEAPELGGDEPVVPVPPTEPTSEDPLQDGIPDASEPLSGPTAHRETPEEHYLRTLLEEAGLTNPTVRRVGNPRHNRYLIRLEQLQGRVEDGLRASFGDAFAEVDRIETVGPRVGEQLRNDGVKAVILALFFILVYIGMRFDMRYAPGAVVALFHDVIIVLGVFTVIREEITLTILAALLTIVGYSLNDTIVVFDRIRENLGSLKAKDLPTVVNQSINETLSRTFLTSGTTLIAVLSIFFLGGGLIRSFALAMILGILVGTYSSIFVASPVMMWVHEWREKRAAQQAVATSGAKSR